MRALLCKELGKPLVIEEVKSLQPKTGEIVIDVKAAGLNYPDTLIVQGKYQFQPELPFSPGGEVAGVVKAIGTEVEHLSIGDRVMAGTSWGGLAEEARSMATNAFIIPDRMSFDLAAVSCMTYGTSYHALVDRAQVKKGETLLVLGAAGGVGTAAIQIAKRLGLKVIAAASTDEKLSYCKETLGADLVINYSTENIKERAKELTGGKGVDVIYDPVGGSMAESVFRAIARNGRYLVVGFAGGNIPSIPFNLPLLKSASIVGVFWGGLFRNEPQVNRKNFEQLTTWFAEGSIQSHIHAEYTLEQVSEAMEEILGRKVKGKCLIKI
ncbi:NADPH:quinone oxidoreductase family protein [Reichenbachiella versicolor]|uniref:NADPH:quinone oxidoreductase family protein n=1 Tax=Reichenbachiella versicolor TaxID=1821036 RepID=UPI000D6DD013|nr:NADPH:quinone oxidoreductase family protein [Reichenbachiella versicolor]